MVLCGFAKILIFLMIFKEFGLLTQLIVSAFYQVLPIMFYFVLYTAFFAELLFVSKSNQAEVD